MKQYDAENYHQIKYLSYWVHVFIWAIFGMAIAIIHMAWDAKLIYLAPIGIITIICLNLAFTIMADSACAKWIRQHDRHETPDQNFF